MAERFGSERRGRTRAETALAMLVVAGSLCGAAGFARAAEEAPASPPPAAAAPAPPSAIPLEELTIRAEQAEALSSQLTRDLAESALGARVDAVLEQAAEDIALAKERTERTLASRYALGELRTLGAVWDSIDATLAGQEAALANRIRELENRLREVRELSDLWQRTRAAVREERAPEVTLRLVERARSELASSETALRTRRNEILGLQEKVSETRISIASARERITVAERDFAASLRVRQDEPLWRDRPSLEDLRGQLDAAVADLSDGGREIVRYGGRHPGRLLIHALFVGSLAWTFSRARTRLERRRGADTGPQPALDALAHPWAAALLAGLLLAPLLHPDAGWSLISLNVLASIPVWLWVLRAMLPASLHGPLGVLAGLAVLAAARSAFREFAILDRALLILELGAALGGVLWLRRPERAGHIPAALRRARWLRPLDLWLRLTAIGFGAGLVAALLGYSNLADRIATVGIWGSYLGASFAAGARILEALVEAALGSAPLDRLRVVRLRGPRILATVRTAVRASAFASWAYLVLRTSQFWEPTRSATTAVLSARVGYGDVSLSMGGMIAFGVTLWVSWMLARLLSFTLDEEVFPRARMPSGVPYAISTFSRYAVLLLGFLVALAMVGFTFDRVALLLSALGVGIGFGLQNVVNNFVSGAILLFERPIRVGDTVQVDDLLGVVTSIGIRASKVRTFDGSDVVVPNGDLVAARVVNWTLSDRKRRVTLPVGVAYGTKPRRVLEILERVARDHPEVLDDPAPDALFRGFGESSLDFELRAFTDSPRGWLPVMSDLAVATSEALEAEGITIPFPQRDLHLRNLPELQKAMAELLRREPGGSGGSDPNRRE